VAKIKKSRKYRTTKKGMETIIAVLVFTQRTMPTILASTNRDAVSDNPIEMNNIDKSYLNIRKEIKEIQKLYGIKTAA
jgi:hypothetical protein